MTNELNWLMNAAKITKQYDECTEKKFVGKLPYRMVMNIIQKNEWSNTRHDNTFWNVSNTKSESVNYSLHYTTKTGVAEFTLYQSII